MTDEQRAQLEQFDEEPDIAKRVAAITALVIAARGRLTALLGKTKVDRLTQKEQRKVIREVNEILAELDDDLRREVSESLTDMYTEGRAHALVALGKFDSKRRALRYLRSDKVVTSRAHRTILTAEIETTMDDLLMMTQNTRRRVKAEVRRVAAEVFRVDENVHAQRRQMVRELQEAGIFAIRDSANRRWKIDHYTEVVVTTKMAQAHRLATEQEAREQGAGYVVISRHGDSCERCAPWQGRLLRISSDVPGSYPTLQQAISGGLFHPMCKHVQTPVIDPDFVPDWVQKN